jgi:hypothetical protein
MRHVQIWNEPHFRQVAQTEPVVRRPGMLRLKSRFRDTHTAVKTTARATSGCGRVEDQIDNDVALNI